MPLSSHDVYLPRSGAKEVDCSAQPERRRRARTRVHWPLVLQKEESSESIETVTQNLSSCGFYCLSPEPVMPGEVLLCTLKTPAYGRKSEFAAIALECRAVVVRAETTPDGFFGLGCRIEDYHLSDISPAL